MNRYSVAKTLHEVLKQAGNELSDHDRAWYLGTGEPFDKAGAYGHQGRAGRFVASIDGSWTAIVGLPLAELATLLTP